MLNKKEVAIFSILFVIIIFSISNAIAWSYNPNIKTSNAGVKYEQKVLYEFSKLEMNKTSNKTFVQIIIQLKDFSDAENLLSIFNESEIKDIAIRNLTKKMGVGLTKEGFDKLISDSRVEAVYYDAPMYFLLDESAPLINATYVWNNLNYTGEGIKVCVIDTGIDKNHPDLENNIVAEKCYCRLGGGCCPDGTSEDNNASDDNGHGTHVAGIIASQNKTYQGIASNVSLHIAKVFGDGTGGSTLDIGEAISWCRGQNVSIISMSLGDRESHPGDSVCPNYYNTEISNAYNDSIAIVAASGNDGYEEGINYPACNNQVISVGATYDDNLGLWYALVHLVLYAPNCWDWSQPDKITCFTSKHSSFLDLLAPGAEITSTWNDGGFEDKGGTSMSTPMVAGAIALMLEKNSSLTPDEIKQILIDTGKPIWDSDTETTYPRIDIAAAIEEVSFCDMTSWTSGSCGAGNCTGFQRQYTRTGTPSGCDSETKCEYDETCIGGRDLTVCSSGCNYTTIQDALDNALATDLIKITDEGTYDNENLNWTAPEDGEVILNCQSATISDNVWGITIQDKGNWGAIINCIINASVGIKITGEGGDHEIMNNVFDVSERGVEFDGNLGGIYFYDNILMNADEEGVELTGSGSPLNRSGGSMIRGNKFFNIYWGIYLDKSSTNIILSNIFEDNTYAMYLDGGDYSLDALIEKNNVSENDYGVYIYHQEQVDLKDNYFCLSNSVSDIYTTTMVQSYGTGNRCENAIGWNDTSTTGCTYYCDTPAEVTLLYPNDNSTYTTQGNVGLVCQSNDNYQLVNVSLYHNISGSWQLNQTKNISGTSNITTFTLTNIPNGTNFIWNCLAYDNKSRGSFADANWSVEVIVDTISPNVNIDSPLNQTYTIPSIDFNVTLNEVGVCMYSLDGGITNVTMGTIYGKNFTTTDLSMTNGGYFVNYYCEDDVGNKNYTEGISFSVNATLPDDPHKYVHKNSSNDIVAWLGNEGNIVLAGSCFSGGSCNSPGDGSLIFRNSSNDNVAFINASGDMCVETGDCSDNSANCNSPTGNSFIVRNSSSTNMIYFDSIGDLCLVGGLYENSDPN